MRSHPLVIVTQHLVPANNQCQLTLVLTLGVSYCPKSGMAKVELLHYQLPNFSNAVRLCIRYAEPNGSYFGSYMYEMKLGVTEM